MLDELQEFSIAYDRSALIHRILGKTALIPLVLLVLAMGLAGSFMDNPASGWQSNIPFAISVTVAFAWLVFLCEDLYLLLMKHPMFVVGPEGITCHHAI